MRVLDVGLEASSIEMDVFDLTPSAEVFIDKAYYFFSRHACLKHGLGLALSGLRIQFYAADKDSAAFFIERTDSLVVVLVCGVPRSTENVT